MSGTLPYGPLGRTAAHLCIDMRTMFAERTDWHLPWMQRVLPAVARLARAHAAETIFTRFVRRHDEQPTVPRAMRLAYLPVGPKQTFADSGD